MMDIKVQLVKQRGSNYVQEAKCAKIFFYDLIEIEVCRRGTYTKKKLKIMM